VTGGEAQQSQHGHEEGGRKERQRHPRIPPTKPEPEVEPHAAVDPDDEEEQELARAGDGIEDP
jgi:hypothetical protein